jgi:hypothetical protein
VKKPGRYALERVDDTGDRCQEDKFVTAHAIGMLYQLLLKKEGNVGFRELKCDKDRSDISWLESSYRIRKSSLEE